MRPAPQGCLTKGSFLTDETQREFEALFTDEYEAVVDRLEFQTGSAVDAEDIAARAFERLLGQLERGTAVSDLHARLNSLAQWLLMDHWRKQARRQKVEWSACDVADLADLEEAAFQNVLYSVDTSEGEVPVQRPYSAEAAEFAADFDLAVRALPRPERDALILTDLRGLSAREAAGLLDVSHTTVTTRRSTALNFVRKELSA